jgi:DNA-binding transcriptional ArsR family regulator
MAAKTSDGPDLPAQGSSEQGGAAASAPTPTRTPEDMSPPADVLGQAPEYATRDMMRAMAHPLRIQLVERIGRRGTARAADLAADLGVPANSVSYHLRTLARGGVIVEAPEAARDKRDRVWKLSQLSYRSEHRSTTNDPAATDTDYLAATAAMSLSAIEWLREAWIREAAYHEEHAADDPGLGQLHPTTLRISKDQAHELFTILDTKIQEYNFLNRTEDGVDVPGDPDSNGDAQNFRILLAMVADRDS